MSFCKFTSAIVSFHLVYWLPLFQLPLIFPSNKVFSSDSCLHTMYPKHYLLIVFQVSICFYFIYLLKCILLRGQDILNSFLQHHNTKAYFSFVHFSWWSSFHSQLVKTDFDNLSLHCKFIFLSRFSLFFPSRSIHLFLSWVQSQSMWI